MVSMHEKFSVAVVASLYRTSTEAAEWKVKDSPAVRSIATTAITCWLTMALRMSSAAS